MIFFRVGGELGGLCPMAGRAGELATLPVFRIILPDELARAPIAAQEPMLETIEPEYDHEFARSTTTQTTGDALAIELLRTNFTLPGEARLSRLVTTLVATPLGGQFAPININTFEDPFRVLVHPGDPAATLRVSWYFIWDTDRIAYAELPLQVGLEANIPRGVSVPNLPERWDDFRYAWQSRYSDERRSTHLVEGFGRLWVVLEAAPLQDGSPSWQARAGGLVELRLARVRLTRDLPGETTKQGR